MDKNNSANSKETSRRAAFSCLSDNQNFVDTLIILWKGKWGIFFSIICMVVITIVYLSSQKDRWTSTSIVTLPLVGQVSSYDTILSNLYSQSSAGSLYAHYPLDILPVTSLQEQLLNRFSTSLTNYTTNSHPQPASFTLSVEALVKNQTAPLRISVTADTANQSQAVLQRAITDVNRQIVNDLIDDMRRKVKRKELELSELLKVQTQIAEMRKVQRLETYKHALKIAEVSNIEHSRLTQVNTLSDDTLFLLGTVSLNAMIANEKIKPLELDKGYYDTQQLFLSLKNINIKEDELQSYSYIQEPDLPEKPNDKKIVLKVILAILAGMIIGSTTILVRNVISEYRKVEFK